MLLAKLWAAFSHHSWPPVFLAVLNLRRGATLGLPRSGRKARHVRLLMGLGRPGASAAPFCLLRRCYARHAARTPRGAALKTLRTRAAFDSGWPPSLFLRLSISIVAQPQHVQGSALPRARHQNQPAQGRDSASKKDRSVPLGLGLQRNEANKI
jgi:hypothetical protein